MLTCKNCSFSDSYKARFHGWPNTEGQSGCTRCPTCRNYIAWEFKEPCAWYQSTTVQELLPIVQMVNQYPKDNHTLSNLEIIHQLFKDDPSKEWLRNILNVSDELVDYNGKLLMAKKLASYPIEQSTEAYNQKREIQSDKQIVQEILTGIQSDDEWIDCE